MPAHLLVAPIVLPLLAGATLLLLERRAPRATASLSIAVTLLQVFLAVLLVGLAADDSVQAYLLGNWPAPFGIALAADRLTALMLLLTALIAVASVLYASSGFDQRTDRRGAHFHPLFQFQLMGLNGAFLTADLFNLFVFFEVLLIASYGLLLHSGGAERLRSAVHYVTFNLAGSALFLIAVATLYGLTGTLNMADLAQRVPQLPASEAGLVRAAALLLLVVFCVKAALLPLYFWLPQAYSAAVAPVAALFAIMTKVGVYAIARMYSLVFGDAGGAAAQVAFPWLPILALATLALAAIGALAARGMRGLVSYLVIASAGTLLLAFGMGSQQAASAGIFYLVNSTLVIAVLYLLAERIAQQRPRDDGLVPCWIGPERWPLALVFFAAAIAVAGIPPLAGFFGKVLLLDAVRGGSMAVWSWAVILVNSFAVIVSLARAGSVIFWWPSTDDPEPRPLVVSTAPMQSLAIGWLLILLLINTVAAGPLATYADATARQLFERRAYIEAVLGTRPEPPALPIRDIVGGKPNK